MRNTPTEDQTDETVGINVQLPAELHRRFKAQAAREGRTLSAAVEEALADYLIGK